MGALPGPLYNLAADARALPLPQRIDRISEWFLGLPHEHDPLGEGGQADTDPLTRYDIFDCLTFVEEVLALALSGDPAHAAEVRLDLRYDGSPGYTTRRHFMELQWLPDNVQRGFLVDTTASYGPVTHRERQVDLAMWQNWADRRRFSHTDSELPLGNMALDILPLDHAIEAAERIRPGSIVAIVREDRPWKPVWITHVGFVVGDSDTTTFRHATAMSKSRKVRDNPLRSYLELLKTYKNWKVEGIAVFEAQEFGPRLLRDDSSK